MARKKISDLRRTELIEAVIDATHEHSFAALTVAQIAEFAQTSTGSIHYYFGGKDALLAATMRHLLDRLKVVTIERLEKAASPRDRLDAIVLANFDDAFFSKKSCSVWVQFWAMAPYSDPLARLQVLNQSRVRSNLLHALKQIVPADQASECCTAIQTYMDGIWLRSCQTGIAVDARKSQQDAMTFLDRLLV